MRDKITPLSGPPGHSLTDTPKKWAWESPPVYTNPDDAVDYVTNNLEKDAVKKDMIKLMLAGISIEELVTQIGFKGFMEGFYTPDVAELIKPSIALYLYGVADEAGFKPTFYAGQKEGEAPNEVDDQTFFGIMKQRNPKLFGAMVEQANEEERFVEAVKEDMISTTINENVNKTEIEDNSFIGVQEQPQEQPMIGAPFVEEQQNIQDEEVI